MAEDIIEELEKLKKSAGDVRDSFDKTADASSSAAGSTKKLTATQQQLQKSANSVAQGFKGAVDGLEAFGTQMFANSTKVSSSLKQLDPVIDGATKAVGGLVGAIPLIGGALKGVAEVVGAGFKVLNDKAQEISETFRDLSKVGGVAAGGMTQLFKTANESGQGLEAFAKTINQNAQTLTQLSGTVFDGVDQFAKVNTTLAQTDKDLRKIGKLPDDIAEGTANYLKQQLRLTSLQGKSVAELTAGSKSYQLELDRLSKLTGLSAEALEKQREEHEKEEQYFANLELAQQGPGGPDAAEAIRQFDNVISSLAPTLAKGLRETTQGTITTEAGEQLARTHPELVGLYGDIASGKKTLAEAQKLLEQSQGVARQTVKGLTPSAALGTGVTGPGGAFLPISEEAKFGVAATPDFQKAADVQDSQIKNTDKLTGNIIDTNIGLEKMNRDINQFVADVLPKYSDGLSKVTDLMEKGLKKTLEWFEGQDSAKGMANSVKEGVVAGIKAVAGVVPELLGWKRGAAKGPGETEAKEASIGQTIKEGLKGAAGGAALSGITVGALTGGIGAIPAAIVGGVAGGYTRAKHYYQHPEAFQQGATAAPNQNNVADLATSDLQKLVNFTRNTGDRRHFENVPPEVQKRFLDMASEYYTKTNGTDKIQLNSSYRDADEQANLDSGTNPKAAPGHSLHQQGLAFDIQPQQVEALKQMGLLDKYKFSPLAGDPPHIQTEGYRTGGISTGPDSGYQQLLHGTEAIVPLPDGKSIPVDIQNLFDNFDMKSGHDEQVKLMQTQIDKMDKLIDAMQKNSGMDIMTKQMQVMREMADKMTRANDISQNILHSVRF